MRKIKWVSTWLLTLTLILSTSVGYAEPEESANTENKNASLLNELQLPTDTPVEAITDTTEYAEDEVIKTAFGSMTILNPNNITSEIQQALDASRTDKSLTPETESTPLPESETTSAPEAEDSPTPEMETAPVKEANNELQQLNNTELEGEAWMTCDIPDEIAIGEERYIYIYFPESAQINIYLGEYLLDFSGPYDYISSTSASTLLSYSSEGSRTIRITGTYTAPGSAPVSIDWSKTYQIVKKFYYDSTFSGEIINVSKAQEEFILDVSAKKTYRFNIVSFAPSNTAADNTYFEIYNEQNQLVAESRPNYMAFKYVEAASSPTNYPEMKALLEPGRYRFVTRNRINLYYTVKKTILESKTPILSEPDYMVNGADVTYSPGQTLYSYWGSQEAYDLSFYINGVQAYTTTVSDEVSTSFDFDKLGTFQLKAEARNSGDMTISGAKKDTCEMTVHIQTSESIESIRTKLQAKITEVQNYYNTFAEQHSFGADDGQYSIAKKNELLLALQNATSLLENAESSKEELYNITVNLTESKSGLNTYLNIGAAYGACSYSSAWAYGRTSQNKTVYLKIYDENHQLLHTYEAVTDDYGYFSIWKDKIFPDNNILVLSVAGSSHAKVFLKNITAPSVNTTFNAENLITVIVSAKNVTNFANCTFEVHYTPAELAPVTFVKNALTPVLSVGTYGDIEITEVGDGVVKFKVLNTTIPSGKYFTGVVNMFQFESLQEGTGTVFAKIVTQ